MLPLLSLILLTASCTVQTSYRLSLSQTGNAPVTATARIIKNYSSLQYNLFASTFKGEKCRATLCISRNFAAISSHGPMPEKHGCMTVVRDIELSIGAQMLPPFTWAAGGTFFINTMLSGTDCLVEYNISGTECENPSQLTENCLYPSQLPIYPKGTMLGWGDAAFFAVRTPETGSFGTISLDISVSSAADYLGALTLYTNGGWYIFSSITFTRETPSIQVELPAARRATDYLFVLEGFGPYPNNFTIESADYQLQDCNKVDSHGPRCSGNWTNPMLVIDEDSEIYFEDGNDWSCTQGWCYFYPYFDDSCTQIWITRKDSSTGDLPHLYMKGENAPTPSDWDVLFAPTSEDEIYFLNKTTSKLDMMGFRYNASTVSGWYLNVNCDSHDNNNPGMVAGIVIGCILAILVIIGLVLFFVRKHRGGYQQIVEDSGL